MKACLKALRGDNKAIASIWKTRKAWVWLLDRFFYSSAFKPTPYTSITALLVVIVSWELFA